MRPAAWPSIRRSGLDLRPVLDHLLDRHVLVRLDRRVVEERRLLEQAVELVVRVEALRRLVEQRRPTAETVTPPTRYSAALALTFGSSASLIQASAVSTLSAVGGIAQASQNDALPSFGVVVLTVS